MPKAENSNAKDKDTPSFEGPRHRPHWLAAFTCLVFGILIIVAMLDFESTQSIQKTTNPTSVNLVGVIGAEYTWWIFHLLGAAAWLIPAFLLRMAYIYLRSSRSLTTTRLLAIICCLVSFSALMAMQETVFTNKEIFTGGPGGQFGAFLYLTLLKDSLGVFGSALIFGTIYLLGFIYIFTRDFIADVARLIHAFAEWRQKRAALAAARAEELRQKREAAAKEAAALAAKAATTTTPPMAPGTTKRMVVPKGEDPLVETARTATIAPMAKPSSTDAALPKTVTRPPLRPEPAADAKAPPAAGKIELNIVKAEETKKAKIALPQSDDKNYEFPPLSTARMPRTFSGS